MDCYRFMRAIIDYGQTFQTAAIGQAIKHKIDGPHFILPARPHQRLAIGHRDLLALAPLHHQLLFPVQPPHSLQIHHHAFVP